MRSAPPILRRSQNSQNRSDHRDIVYFFDGACVPSLTHSRIRTNPIGSISRSGWWIRLDAEIVRDIAPGSGADLSFPPARMPVPRQGQAAEVVQTFLSVFPKGTPIKGIFTEPYARGSDILISVSCSGCLFLAALTISGQLYAQKPYDLLLRGGLVSMRRMALMPFEMLPSPAARSLLLRRTFPRIKPGVVDVSSLIVAPGLVDIHTHVFADSVDREYTGEWRPTGRVHLSKRCNNGGGCRQRDWRAL